MVVGLGNPDIVVDSLGTRVAKKVIVTNHIMDEIKKEGGVVRPVSVFLPGVMGCTGIETREIVKGVCDRVKPALVIVVDSLVARAIERLNATIQIADAGLSPGEGMSYGVKKSAIDKDFLGVPVIAIGATVVIDVTTLVNGVIGLATPPETMSGGDYKGDDYLSALMSSANDGNRREKSIRQTLLEDYALSFVAPKEADEIITNFADIIAMAVNLALHKGLTIEQLSQYGSCLDGLFLL